MKQYTYLLVPIVSWLVAQTLKYVFQLRRDGFQINDFFSSGGMPSSHSAFVASFASMVAFREGLESPLFAASFVLGAIVMYDAQGVRRSVGDQYEALKTVANKKTLDKIHYSRGHTLPQIFGGAIIGFVVAALTYKAYFL